MRGRFGETPGAWVGEGYGAVSIWESHDVVRIGHVGRAMVPMSVGEQRVQGMVGALVSSEQLPQGGPDECRAESCPESEEDQGWCEW